MSDFDENIDPLDPRFVDAVLARARQRATTRDPASEVSDATAATPAADVTPPPAAPPAAPTPPAPAPASAAPPSLAPEPPAEPPRVEPVTPSPTFETPTIDAPTFDPTPPDEPSVPRWEDEPSPQRTATMVAAADAYSQTAGDAPDLADDDEEDDSRRRTRNAVEWIAVAVGAVIVAFLIRAFLLQAFYIPSESMEPTLRKNDRILVNKLSYKLHDINRGDLVVFEKPPNEPASDINDLIKRVIARPGETIEMHTDGAITIDGRLLNEPYLPEGQPPGPMIMERDQFVEGACTNPVAETARCTVGEGFIFVMGDNRDHSHDSRAFGPIDEDLVVGRAFVKVWPLSGIGFL